MCCKGPLNVLTLVREKNRALISNVTFKINDHYSCAKSSRFKIWYMCTSCKYIFIIDDDNKTLVAVYHESQFTELMKYEMWF